MLRYKRREKSNSFEDKTYVPKPTIAHTNLEQDLNWQWQKVSGDGRCSQGNKAD
jgi:hypothetical protein